MTKLNKAPITVFVFAVFMGGTTIVHGQGQPRSAPSEPSIDSQDSPLVEVGAPFGKLRLIEEIDTAKIPPAQQGPENVSRIEVILGKPCRVLPKTDGESAYFSYRIGQAKQLRPGAAYVLEVEYPEDAPRSVIVMNGANETISGFHTGPTFGDALYPKYVNNLNESLDLPLSGNYETWTHLIHLHDRTPNIRFIRGDAEPRVLRAEDGFTVTFAQFSAENIPFSRGAAVSRIRLFAVDDSTRLEAQYRLPEGLPHRRLFWREEMSDGVVSVDESRRGVIDRLDWWKFKRNRMKFLGFNTFTKDLLEFGAVQHWDTTPGGGNEWAYFDQQSKDLWPQIVSVMGEAGFTVLPYYEYSGSKGAHGLGNQRRAKPLRRNDAYSHTSWIESANVDITDPDTFADFKKMLDLTVIRFQDRAQFAGAWIRSRGQLPISFADTTLRRFAEETEQAAAITRQSLIDDGELLARYKTWWNGKRHQFLVAMRDHLRVNGIAQADMLYTTEAAESGVPFPTWDRIVVADDVSRLDPILSSNQQKPLVPLSVEQVTNGHLYLNALKAEPLNWGGWELNHRDPPADPQTYKDTDGVLLTHAFNRLYTVADPNTFAAFRNPAGLAMVRHFSLNEHMIYDADDKPALGYFVVDIERAGPYCMMAEAHAMANGDPTSIGYLSGGNFNRGFPKFVRSFNTAFLSLPALPSQVVDGATDDPEIVVRHIHTDEQGDYFAVVSLSTTAKQSAVVRLPVSGAITDAATGRPIVSADRQSVTLNMHPFQLRSLHVK